LADDKNFTTGFMSGRSMPEPIESCTTDLERQNLQLQIKQILHKLNSELKEKYKNSTEIGCDFILAGNGADVYFGEANHHCQGLIPLAEIIQNKISANSFYQQIDGLEVSCDAGLANVREIIKQQIALQKNNFID